MRKKANAHDTADQLQHTVVDCKREDGKGYRSWKREGKTLVSLVNGSNLIWLPPKGTNSPWQLLAGGGAVISMTPPFVVRIENPTKCRGGGAAE